MVSKNFLLIFIVDDIEMKTTLRQILEKFITSKYGQYIEIFSTFISLVSCIIYVVSTYIDEDDIK